MNWDFLSEKISSFFEETKENGFPHNRWFIGCTVLIALIVVTWSFWPSDPTPSSVLNAAGRGDIESVRSLIPQSFAANVRGRFRRTPLHAAANEGSSEAVQYLLEQGADINAVDRFGSTPLMYAGLQGGDTIAQLLLEKGAKIDLRDNHGSTALMYAAWGGHSEIVSTLVSAGASVNARNRAGSTALFDAAIGGHAKTVRTLLELGADPGIRDRTGATIFSRVKAEEKIVKVLLRHDPALYTGKSALEGLVQLIREDKLELVRIFLEKDVSLNATTKKGFTPLAAACAQKNPDTKIVRLLLNQGADPNYRPGSPSSFKGTPLFFSALAGHNKIIRILLNHGAEVNLKINLDGLDDFQGEWTALMGAAYIGHTSSVKLLLQRGADPNFTNDQGMSALELSRQQNHTKTIKLLEKHTNP